MANVTVSTLPPDFSLFTPFIIFMLIIGIIGIVSNILILTNYPFKTSNKGNLFIKILAIIDLCSCLFGIPFTICLEMGYVRNNIICKLTSFVLSYLVTVSVFTFAFLAIERWLSLSKPHKTIPPYLTNLMIVTICLSGVLTGSISIAISTIGPKLRYDSRLLRNCYWKRISSMANVYRILAIAIFCIVLLINIFIYTLIYKIILKRKKFLSNLNVTANEDKLKKNDLKSLKNHARNATMLFGVTVIFFFTWLPFLFSNFGVFPKNIFVHYSFLLNNLTNFFVYFSFQKVFRQNLHKCLKTVKKRARIVPQ